MIRVFVGADAQCCGWLAGLCCAGLDREALLYSSAASAGVRCAYIHSFAYRAASRYTRVQWMVVAAKDGFISKWVSALNADKRHSYSSAGICLFRPRNTEPVLPVVLLLHDLRGDWSWNSTISKNDSGDSKAEIGKVNCRYKYC